MNDQTVELTSNGSDAHGYQIDPQYRVHISHQIDLSLRVGTHCHPACLGKRLPFYALRFALCVRYVCVYVCVCMYMYVCLTYQILHSIQYVDRFLLLLVRTVWYMYINIIVCMYVCTVCK